MLNTYEVVHEIVPTKDGDHVSLSVGYERGRGYRFRVTPFFDKGWSREYHVHMGRPNIGIDFPCSRQSGKRYEEAKRTAFDYIYSDAGQSALDERGIVLLGKVSEREYDRYA